MTLHDLEAFVAVVETGSINRAALRLNLSQPATTRRVQNFEAAIGATLLDRSIKPPVLTAVGRHVLEHCRRVLKAVIELETSTFDSDTPAGDLRIGLAHGHAEVLLSTPLDDLRRRFPKLRLRVTSNWTTRLIEDVHNGALDCAIGLLTKEHAVPAGMRAIALGMESVVVVAARGTRPRPKGRGRLHLRDLADRMWVLNPPGCGCRAALERAFDHANVPMGVITEVFGEDLQLSLVARGFGLTFVPRRQLDANPHRRKLQVVNVTDCKLRPAIMMLHGSSLGRLAAAVDRLETRIADWLRRHK